MRIQLLKARDSHLGTPKTWLAEIEKGTTCFICKKEIEGGYGFIINDEKLICESHTRLNDAEEFEEAHIPICEFETAKPAKFLKVD